MMPMIPPSHLEELAREHLDSHARLYRARHIEDPAIFMSNSVLARKLFGTLRRLVVTASTGTARSWRDARHPRRHEEPGTDLLPAADGERLSDA